MPGAELAAEPVNQVSRRHHHGCLLGATTIEVCYGRRKHSLDTGILTELEIAFHRARIFLEIFCRTKLQWINEDRDNRGLTLGCRTLDQAEMSFMQGAHRRHEAKKRPGSPPVSGQLGLRQALAPGPELVNRAQYFGSH